MLRAVLPQRPVVSRHSGAGARVWLRQARVCVPSRWERILRAERESQKDLAGCSVIEGGQ